jgi:hypothetical protein
MAGVQELPRPLREAQQPDPVLAALIAKLPPTGSVWPAKKRAAWIQLIWTTFELVYELEAGDMLELPAFLSAVGPVSSATVAPAAAAEAAKPAPSSFAFYIDRDGFARRADHARVLAGDVGGNILYDERGEGDFMTIVWADNSVGVPRGLQLDIAPAF